MPIEMQSLTSNLLEAAGYDEATQVLDIEFKNGDTYSYDNVPKDVFTGLMNAASSGQFFHRNIKGRYRFYRG